MLKGSNIVIILFLVVFISCTEKQKKDNNKLQIVCTTNILANTVKNLVDTTAQVVSLMGPGVDPHLYKASQGDISKLRNADVIIYNGLHLEGKMIDVLTKMSKYKTVYDFSSGCDTSDFIKTADFDDSFDPHYWFDVKLWGKACKSLTKLIISLDTLNKNQYKSNLNEFTTTLEKLNQFIVSSIDSIPSQQRILITAHDAFNYFGKRYGIIVRGLQGISTQAEFGLKDRIELVNYIIENNIKAIFIESSVSKRNISSVIEGCQAKGHQVVIGGSLYSDALGAEGTPQGNYEGMVKHNVLTIVNALK